LAGPHVDPQVRQGRGAYAPLRRPRAQGRRCEADLPRPPTVLIGLRLGGSTEPWYGGFDEPDRSLPGSDRVRPGAVRAPPRTLSAFRALEEAARWGLAGERAFQDALPALARRMLERFIERFPDDKRTPEPPLPLAKPRLALGAFPAALEALRKAQTFSPPPGK